MENDAKPGTKCSCGRVIVDANGQGGYYIVYDAEGKLKGYLCDTCDRVSRLDHYKKTGIISSKLLLDASSADFHFNDKYHTPEETLGRLRPEVKEFLMQNKNTLLEINDTIQKAHELVRKFEEKHWVPYLKKYWNKTSHRGHEAEANGTTVLMWGSAGRVLITCRQGDSDVTMIFSDYEKSDELCGGIQGIGATKDTILKILTDVLEPRKLKFKHKESVTLAGF